MAAAQWKALAVTTTEALNEANAAPFGLYFGAACTALAHRTAQLRDLASGQPVDWNNIILDGPDSATAKLGDASRAFARYHELHNRFVRVFSIYGGLTQVLVDGPLWHRDLNPLHRADDTWRTWVQRRAVAYDYIHQASQRLRALAAYDLATVDALTVARSFPEHSQGWIAWVRAAEGLATRAQAEANAASQIRQSMYNAVLLECGSGWEISN